MNRCSLCPGVHNCVPPSGPQDLGQPMFVGEAPGYEEDKSRVPFVGKTGREVDGSYLPAAGLRRDNCYFTNSIKCLPNTSGHKLDPKKKSDQDLLDSCSSYHLYREIERLQPSVIVAMGAFACKTINPDISLDVHHGIPQESPWGIPVFPMYHPAGGLHEPKKMLQIRTDWIRLKRYLNGKLSIYRDPYPSPDYREVEDPGEIDSLDPTLPLGADTEYSRSLGPYCITYSQRPGTGRLIRASRRDLLTRLQAKLDTWRSIIIFHNWLYDWTVTEEMGLRLPYKRVKDTMVRSFHLGNLPQALKILAYRELGMEMQDFVDLVVPYSRPLNLEYYQIAKLHNWPKPDPIEERQDDGTWKTKNPQGMNTKLKRFFTDFSKNPDKDVFKMWTDNWTGSQEMIESVIGPWPGMDIAHVPIEKVIHYACRDADADLRLYRVQQKMKSKMRGKPQENWRM